MLFSFGLLMLTTFHNGSRELICTHYLIIIFALVFVSVTILMLTNNVHCCRINRFVRAFTREVPIRTVPIVEDPFGEEPTGCYASLPFIWVLTIANTWSLRPCTTTMYSLNTSMTAIEITAFIAIIMTIFAFKMDWDLTRKGLTLFGCLFVLMVSFIIFACTNRDNIVYLFLTSLCLFLLAIYLMCTYFPANSSELFFGIQFNF